MADKRVTVTIEAIDKATAVFKNINKEIGNLGKTGTDINSSFGKLGTTIAKFKSAMTSTKGQIALAITGFAKMGLAIDKIYQASKQNFTEGLQKLVSFCGTVISALGNVALKFRDILQAVTGTDLSLAGLIKTGVGYEQALARISMKSGETGYMIEDLGVVIQDLTERTVFSATEIAAAAENMIQNGRSVEEVISDIYAVTMLATAGNIELARAGDIVSQTMNMFSNDTLTAVQVASILSKAANTSGADVDSLAKSLQNCGPQANNLKIPLTEVATVLAVMGDNAIKSGKAGTALKNLFQRMNNPPKAAAKAIKDYNLEVAQGYIQSGRLIDGLIEMKKQFEAQHVSATKQSAAIKDLTGSYGEAGLTAVLSRSELELRAVAKAMEDGKVNTDDLAHSVDALMDTTEGKMYKLSAAIEMFAIKFKEQTNGIVNDLLDFATTFMDKLTNEGPAEAFRWMADQTAIHMDDMRQSVMDGFEKIKAFVSDGGVLDNMLRAGTNIIKALCDGIREAYDNGTLETIMTNVIGKVCDFINNNVDDIIDAGTKIVDSLCEGVGNNKDKVETAIGKILDLFNAGGKLQGKIDTCMTQFATTMVDKFAEAIGQKLKNKKNEILGYIKDLFTLDGVENGNLDGLKNGDKNKTGLNQSGPKDGGWLTDLLSSAGLISEAYADEVETTLDGRKPFSTASQREMQALQQKMGEHGNAHGGYYIDEVDGSLRDGGGRVIATADEIANTSAADIQAALESMDVGQLEALNTAMTDLGAATTQTAAEMGVAFQSIQNSARTAFLGLANIVRNQMVAVSNIVRNQMVNCSNIFRNQFVHMANIAKNQMTNIIDGIRGKMVNSCNIVRSQCVNMANIFRNQFVNMANICRNQMVNITNIINNQAPKWAKIITAGGNSAAAALRVSFARMRNNAASSMAAVLSTVRSYMSQIAAACNKQLTIKVNVQKTVTTTEKTVKEGPSSLSMTIPRATSLSGMTRGMGSDSINLGTLMGAVTASATRGQTVNIEVPLYLEGREIARASAKYMDGELSRVNTRTDRKRGVK